MINDREGPEAMNKMVAMQEFEGFVDKYGGASKGDREAQYQNLKK